MDVEGVTDFRALRAKFQNDSTLASKLVQPHKKPPSAIPHKLGSGGNAVSSTLPLSKRQVLTLKPKDEPAHHTSQPSVLNQCPPLVWPRAKLGYVEPTGHNEETKGNISEKRISSPKKGPEKPLPSCCTEQQGSARTSPEGPPLPNSFHRALQIWENTFSRGGRASAMLPTPRAANLYVQPCLEQRVTRAPAALASSRLPPSGSKLALDLPAQKKDALCSSGSALPWAPRRHDSSDEAAAERAVATAACQQGYLVPGEQLQHEKELEPLSGKPRAGKSPGNKQPRIKPLPSAGSLGPAPGKPARPPKLDLSAFQSTMPWVHRRRDTTADQEDYLIPESAQLEKQHNYEETPMYLNQSGDTTTLCVIEVPEAEPREHKKQKTFLVAQSSPGRPGIENEKEEKTSLGGDKQEALKNFKTDGNEYVSPTSQTRKNGRDGKKVLQVKQDVTSTLTAKHPTPQGLAKDTELSRYVSVGAAKPGVERTALNQDTCQSLQAPEDIYDDVEEIQDRLSHLSDASSPFTSASISGNSYEETYEDVEVGGDNPAKTETENQKTFGNLFKIEKLKLKPIRFKETLRLFSISVPNLAVSQEDTVYDDVEVGQREPREIEDKSKTWKPKFLMAKEDKDQRKSSGDVESTIKRSKPSTQPLPSARSPARGELISWSAGEQLDVDVTEGNTVICHNLESRSMFAESLWHQQPLCNPLLRSKQQYVLCA